MKWNDMIHRGGAWTRTVLVATALVTTACVTGCGGDDTTTPTGPEDTGAPDTGTGADTNVPDTNVVDSGTPDTNPVDTGTPDTNPLPFAATPQCTPAPGPYTAAQNVQLSTATAGAQIFYTVDGTQPNTSSQQFSTAINVPATTTIKAIAHKAGFQDSALATCTYTISTPPGQVANVTFSTGTGPVTANNNLNVSLTETTSGATICYTLDATTPACVNGVCQGVSIAYVTGTPVVISTTATTLTALGCKAGMTDSNLSSATYTLNAANPTFAVTSGTAVGNTFESAGGAVTVSTATSGATIHYTTNGTQASCSSTCTATTCGTGGASNATIAVSQNTTIHAVACKTGFNDSADQNQAYLVKAVTPSFDKTALNGTDPWHANPFTVTVSGTTGDVLCYSLTATAPTCNAAGTACGSGNAVSGAITIPANQTNLRAVACNATHAQSNTQSVVYSLQAAGPTFSPAGNTVAPGSGNVTVTSSTSGSTIHWNTSGASMSCADTCTATTCGTAGSGTATATGVVAGTTVYAIACLTGYAQSPLTQASYLATGNTVVVTVAPTGGVKDNDTTVTITPAPVTGTTICYRLSDPASPADAGCTPALATDTGAPACDANSTAYTGPVNLTSNINATLGTQLSATACNTGFNAAPVVNNTYILTAGAPTLLGSWDGAAAVNHAADTTVYAGVYTFGSSTTGVTYHYNTCATSGCTPTAPTCGTGTVATSIDVEATTGISVIACKGSYVASSITTAHFNTVQVGLPILTATPSRPFYNGSGSPPPSYNPFQLVATDFTPGVTLCVRNDLILPAQCDASGGCAAGSTQYTAGSTGIAINQSNFNFLGNTYAVWDFAACKAGLTSAPNPNSNAIDTYDVETAWDLTVTTPQFSPDPTTTYTTRQNVSISISPPPTGQETTAGAWVCYRTDGVMPNCTTTANTCPTGATLWSGTAINIDQNTTIAAHACAIGFDQNTGQATAAYALTPYRHTLLFDGTNDFASADTFTTTTAGYTAYVTYDATNLYLGMNGTAVGSNSASNLVHTYISGSGATTTTADTMTPATGSPTLPFGAKYHLIWASDGSVFTIHAWSGSAWVAGPAISASNVVLNGNFVEFKVPLASLAIPASDVLQLAGGIWNGTSEIAGWPTMGGAAFANYLQVDLDSVDNPNSSGNIH